MATYTIDLRDPSVPCSVNVEPGNYSTVSFEPTKPDGVFILTLEPAVGSQAGTSATLAKSESLARSAEVLEEASLPTSRSIMFDLNLSTPTSGSAGGSVSRVEISAQPQPGQFMANLFS